MKELYVTAQKPVGNVSLIENQFYEVLKRYLLKEDKKCLVDSHRGESMELSETEDRDIRFGNYVLKISLEEKLK